MAETAYSGMSFEPDYRYMLDVLANRQPARLPIYEHIISPAIMEMYLDQPFVDLREGDAADREAFFRHYCRFFKEMTYDTVSFEVCITEILPEHGAIIDGGPGPIQTRGDFGRFPWEELPDRFWSVAEPEFNTLARCLPPGMKALGGVGNGVFEISMDLVGFEYLAYMMGEDPELVSDLYQRIGDLMAEIWSRFLDRYTDTFAICRFGDDLGFKTSTLVSPDTIRRHIIPQYRRVIDLIHASGRPFLWHSCGRIFAIMEDMIEAGIDAKHSNEDNIAPFDDWIALYGDRIGLLGGIDLDVLCREAPEAIFGMVVEAGKRFRAAANGYALGSGNSIPDYVPLDGYLAMVRAAQTIRGSEP